MASVEHPNLLYTISFLSLQTKSGKLKNHLPLAMPKKDAASIRAKGED